MKKTTPSIVGMMLLSGYSIAQNNIDISNQSLIKNDNQSNLNIQDNVFEKQDMIKNHINYSSDSSTVLYSKIMLEHVSMSDYWAN